MDPSTQRPQHVHSETDELLGKEEDSAWVLELEGPGEPPTKPATPLWAWGLLVASVGGRRGVAPAPPLQKT